MILLQVSRYVSFFSRNFLHVEEKGLKKFHGLGSCEITRFLLPTLLERGPMLGGKLDTLPVTVTQVQVSLSFQPWLSVSLFINSSLFMICPLKIFARVFQSGFCGMLIDFSKRWVRRLVFIGFYRRRKMRGKRAGKNWDSVGCFRNC